MQEISPLRYQSIRNFTRELCEPLRTEDFVAQPVVDVSPPKWHLAHTTWFFENFILKPHLKGYKSFHPQYNYLFNSYYNSVGQRVMRPNRGTMTRPGVEDILKYREHVDAGMDKLLTKGLSDENLLNFIEIGLQHEQQHQELLVTDLKFILNQAPIFPAYREDYHPSSLKSQSTSYYRFKEGLYDIGFDGEGFAFDNEREKHKVYLRAFGIADRLVNNAEFYEFMLDGGYENPMFWLSDGWDWLQQNKINTPLYWHKHQEEYKIFTLFGLKEIDWYAPVTHVSFYEADAFARWKGMRLPTEAEWEVTVEDYGEIDASNFVEDQRFKPIANGHNQLYGDCWEWCNSAYLPYPGYKQEAGALGEYNGKFMINQMVLRGGSCVTSRSHIRASYRNFFHPHLQWQFSGIRLAKDL